MTPANTYAMLSKAGMSIRDLEASALLKAAARLTTALAAGDDESIGAALTHNQRLWAHFTAAVTDESCPLPKEARARILTLAAFVFNQSLIGAGKRGREVAPGLVAINRELAAGLRGQ